MRECAHVSIIKNSLSKESIILGYIVIYVIIVTKYHVYGKSNKLIGWIAVWKEVIKSLPLKIIDNFCGYIYDYVKKLVTLSVNLKNSSVVINGIYQLLSVKAITNISHCYGYLNNTIHHKYMIRFINLLAQGSKDNRTLNTDDTELGEVTAEGIIYQSRAQNLRSNKKEDSKI